MSTSTSAAARWLAVGRDVLVTGDVGAGKTWTVHAVADAALREGQSVLRLDCRDPDRPYGPLLAHAGAPRSEPTERGWVTWAAGELAGRRALVAVDGLERVDASTVAVLREALDRPGARLVATVGPDLTQTYDSPAAVLVSERAPAQVRIEGMGLSETARLLRDALGSPASIGVVSAVTTRSAGNPRVALALVDAARVAGAVALEDGVWVKTRPLTSASAESVAHALLPALPQGEREALAALAEHGVLDLPTATALVGVPTLSTLVRRGRVMVHTADAGESLVVVSPPALGHALRSGVLGPRAPHLERRTAAAQPPASLEMAEPVQSTPAPEPDSTTRTSPSSVSSVGPERFSRWAAAIAVLVHSRAQDQAARRRVDWQLAPTVAHASALLLELLRHPVLDGDVETVVAATEHAETDTSADERLFETLVARWQVWRGDTSGVVPAAGPRTADVERAQARILRVLSGTGDDDEMLAATSVGSSGTADDGVVATWGPSLQATVLLQAGRPDLALAVCERTTTAPGARRLTQHLDGVRAEALLLLGRLDEAGRFAQVELDLALSRLDSAGIRTHAWTLAATLGARGRRDEAWRVLSIALRLGSPGPLENDVYRRSLAVGALLRSQAGDTVLAGALAAELDHFSAAYQPLLSAMLAITRATLDPGTATSEALWEEGRRAAATGLLLPALWCWLSHPGPLSPVRAHEVRKVYDATRAPVLEPLVLLHEALAAGDLDALASLADTADVLLSDGPRRTAWSLLGREAPPVQTSEALDDVMSLLTGRERQVARLARDGLSNKEIAAELTLSIRTVETHMSSVLHKLGLTGRQDLTQYLVV